MARGYSNFLGLSTTTTPGAFERIFLTSSAVNFLLCLDIDRFGVAIEDRHPHRCGGHPDGIVLHDLLRLVDHLHLFFGVTVVQEDVDMGEAVEGDLMGIDLLLDLLLVVDGEDLGSPVP